MYRLLGIACLSLFPLGVLKVCGQEKVDVASHLLRWTGSAYQDADAFIVTATIFPSKVELHWDGLAGKSFDFMDEPGAARPPRVQKDFAITDAATVKAFREVAEYANYCDPGVTMVLGQGVSTEAVVEIPPGKKVHEMGFFHPASYLTRSTRFEKIPFEARSLVVRNMGTVIPARDPFCAHLRDLAGDLSRFSRCQNELWEAYDKGADLPLVSLDAMRVPIPAGRGIRLLGGSDDRPEETRKALDLVAALLGDCFGPASRGRFTGGPGEGGVIVTVGRASHDSLELAPESMPVKLGKPGVSLARLPRELEDSIIFFVVGPAMATNKQAKEVGVNIADNFRLRLSNSGALELALSRQGDVWDELEHLNLRLEAVVDHPETRKRLAYLNNKGIVPFMLGGKIGEGKLPALVVIESLSTKNSERGVITFWSKEQLQVAELFLAEGRWTPGRVMSWEDFASKRDPFETGELPE